MNVIEAIIGLVIVILLTVILGFHGMERRNTVSFDTMLTHVAVNQYYTDALSNNDGYNVRNAICLSDTTRHRLYLFFDAEYDGYEVGFVGVEQ